MQTLSDSKRKKPPNLLLSLSNNSIKSSGSTIKLMKSPREKETNLNYSHSNSGFIYADGKIKQRQATASPLNKTVQAPFFAKPPTLTGSMTARSPIKPGIVDKIGLTLDFGTTVPLSTRLSTRTKDTSRIIPQAKKDNFVFPNQVFSKQRRPGTALDRSGVRYEFLNFIDF